MDRISHPDLSSVQRLVLRHLDSLEEGFGPAADLVIVEELCRGVPVEAIAKRIGSSSHDVVARWYQMLFPAITTEMGVLTIDGRRDLLVAVRRRAGTA
ncbi:hypothetical protein RGQ15_07070 [Paracoccus sp. MBLB3053]|uniref:Uncharacterized protein n=1 Tax=Paracoccus aurantius TaxID=3073814 RepID=A0ABU2HRU8_9RHOB|nr:hypothetical protein [Paracoccus sp. MBLB3053]MDS9467334.1 hypothetical protein [Paracoccus sp. MBLB3053]